MIKQLEAVVNSLNELGVDSGFLHVMNNQFALMGIVEEEMLNLRAVYPERQLAIHNAFLMMNPSRALYASSVVVHSVYRAHVRELLRRVALQQDTRPGTHAEMLQVTSEMCMRFAFNEGGMFIYFTLWQAAFGDDAWMMEQLARIFATYRPREPYQGYADEMIGVMRRHTTDPARVAKPAADWYALPAPVGADATATASRAPTYRHDSLLPLTGLQQLSLIVDGINQEC